MRNLVSVAAWIVVVLALGSPAGHAREPDGMSFDGPSGELKATTIVATLDAVIPRRRNAVWTASFVSAWKAIQDGLADGSVALDPKSEFGISLNRAPDPTRHVPPAALYAAAGRPADGIVARIQSEMRRRFPAKAPPEFPNLRPDGLVAYAYLEAGIKFPQPYIRNQSAHSFKDASGMQTPIRTFGLLPAEHSAPSLLDQPRILFARSAPGRRGKGTDPNPGADLTAFAIDLDANSSPSQIVVARIPRQPTLAAAVEHVERQVAARASLKDDPDNPSRLRSGDVLLVPEMLWQISHRFGELEGTSITNGRFRGQRIEVAQQDLRFRLDRYGAELVAESWITTLGAGRWSPPRRFVLDGPFLRLHEAARGAAAVLGDVGGQRRVAAAVAWRMVSEASSRRPRVHGAETSAATVRDRFARKTAPELAQPHTGGIAAVNRALVRAIRRP